MIRMHDNERGRASGLRALKIAFALLAVAACGGSISANPVLAAVQDSRFEFSTDGANVYFDARDVPRREVLDRLFAGTDIELKWLSSSFADERITGKFSGAQAVVARQLLSQTNFVIGYDDKSRPSRVIIVGPATKEQGSAALAALTAAIGSGANRSAKAESLRKDPPQRSAEAATTGPVPTVTPGSAVPQLTPTTEPVPAPTPTPGTAVPPVPERMRPGSARTPAPSVDSPTAPPGPAGSTGK